MISNLLHTIYLYSYISHYTDQYLQHYRYFGDTSTGFGLYRNGAIIKVYNFRVLNREGYQNFNIMDRNMVAVAVASRNY